ncbi:hypothetical protein [Nonomuraea diastatica]|uniref:Matrixin family metalloprotease n=1 Tax=Nonomuraea diastatica TaxID=1848329 RepID=A0A4R4WV94_9ACTN|nr:hypothetical protein [Nonomuraea diastatica]TDD21591.1 hypothetical protein E1294_14205 [Nonomuraea diastatica]
MRLPDIKGSTRGRRWQVVIAIATALALITGTAWAAVFYNMVPNPNYDRVCTKGDKYGSGNVCRSDNAYWTVFRENSLESAEKTRVATVLKEQYGPTALEVHFVSNPVWTGDNETDLIFAEGDVPGSYEGMSWCDDPLELHTCDQHMVRIQPGSYSKGMICHEAGHAVGLLHGRNADPQVSNTHHQLGCMKTPVPSDAVLGSVNADHINAAY